MPSPRFEIRPLGQWDRPRSEPQPSRFRARWDDTITLLLREVEHLDGQLVVVQVDAPAGQIRRDGMLYARAQVASPAVKISFDSRHGPLTYATDAYGYWQDNVRAIALALGALRAVDRYGVSGSGEQYRGWAQIAAAPAEIEMTLDEAARVLADAVQVRSEFVKGFADILVNAAGPKPFVSAESIADARAAITKLHRIAARKAHPDAGGNPDVFRLITKARDVLLGGETCA